VGRLWAIFPSWWAFNYLAHAGMHLICPISILGLQCKCVHRQIYRPWTEQVRRLLLNNKPCPPSHTHIGCVKRPISLVWSEELMKHQASYNKPTILRRQRVVWHVPALLEVRAVQRQVNASSTQLVVKAHFALMLLHCALTSENTERCFISPFCRDY
jgi:hypothetical protein